MATSNKAVTVRVTRKDITNGVQGDTAKCAVARAVRRATGFRMTHVTGSNVKVVKRGTDVVTGEVRFCAKLPTRAISFVRKFDDDRQNVKPLTFKLTLRKPGTGEYIL